MIKKIERYSVRVTKSGNAYIDILIKGESKKSLSLNEFEDYIKENKVSKTDIAKIKSELSEFNKKLKRALEFNPRQK